MKQLLMALGISAMLFSCHSKNSDPTALSPAEQDSILKQAEKIKAKRVKERQDSIRIVKEEQKSAAAENPATTDPQATTTHKKGWSKAAKGAVLGAAGGAVAGAIIDKKNPGAGAVVGGVVGAGVGYGIGRSKDKKDGR